MALQNATKVGKEKVVTSRHAKTIAIIEAIVQKMENVSATMDTAV